MQNESKIVDVEKILHKRIGAKSKYVPKFLVNWLKKILHEDDLNILLTSVSHLHGTDWLEGCVKYLKLTLDVKGLENLPDPTDGHRYTFVSNHPTGAPDGIILGSIIGRRYDGNFRYLVNDFLMNIPNFAPMCIPVNKVGKKGRSALKEVSDGFASDHHILIFPAGISSRKQKGVIHDIPWKKTFIKKSVETHRDIVPIHIEGRNSERFYRIANFFNFFRLKWNPVMALLIDEMYRNVGKTFRITIGKPIPWQTFDKSKTSSDWAMYVEDKVYEL